VARTKASCADEVPHLQGEWFTTALSSPVRGRWRGHQGLETAFAPDGELAILEASRAIAEKR
jgi:hypothetical protein